MGPGAGMGAVVFTLHAPGWHRGAVETSWPVGRYVPGDRLEAGAHARLCTGTGDGHRNGAGLAIEAAPSTYLELWRNKNTAVSNEWHHPLSECSSAVLEISNIKI